VTGADPSTVGHTDERKLTTISKVGGPSGQRRVLFAATIGTFVEYYEFTVYGYFATTLASQFFPHSSATAALILVLSTFALSYLVRPLGAIIWAPLGDRLGRRRVLAAVVLLMTGATTLIGLLPTYATIGIAAPILLAVLRLVQGISAGGEYGGAASMVAEFDPRGRSRGFHLSVVPFALALSLLAGSAISLALQGGLSAEAISSWGWRIPFLIALPMGLIGLYIRISLQETPAFRKLAEQGAIAATPLRTSLRRDYRAILLGIGIVCMHVMSVSLFIVYMPSHLQRFGGFNAWSASWITMVGIVVFTAAIPVCGRLTDRFGRKPVIAVGTAGIGILSFPVYWATSSGEPALAAISLVVVGPFLSACAAGVTAAITEIFATDTRYTGMSLGWQTSTMIFGGTTPLVAASLVAVSGWPLIPAIYGILGAVISLAAVAKIRETKDAVLDTVPDTI
jgi:MFS transporter, MHS family, proline/betaine transporter